jgi:hypothetical protein
MSSIKNDLIKISYKKIFNINNFLWLTNRFLESYYLKFFFYKKSMLFKNTKVNKTFFFNFRNKKLKTYKQARNTHWNFFTTKTIKKKRYQKFLDYFLKKQRNLVNNVFSYFIFKFSLSYKFWSSFSFMYSSIYVKSIKSKEIFQLPIHLSFWTLINNYSFDKKKINFKIADWQNKRLRIRKTFWMQQKKKIPKYLKRIVFNVEGISNCIQYDFITNYFAILKDYRETTHNNLFIFKNKFLKLHGFKYNS